MVSEKPTWKRMRMPKEQALYLLVQQPACSMAFLSSW
jgi:hypothetical protein